MDKKASKKTLNLKVKTLEKKTAPMVSRCGASPVIGYC